MLPGVTVPQNGRKFNPHMTLFQTRDHTVEEHIGYNIPPNVVSQMKNTKFGLQIVGAIQLLAIDKTLPYSESYPKLLDDVSFVL